MVHGWMNSCAIVNIMYLLYSFLLMLQSKRSDVTTAVVGSVQHWKAHLQMNVTYAAQFYMKFNQ